MGMGEELRQASQWMERASACGSLIRTCAPVQNGSSDSRATADDPSGKACVDNSLAKYLAIYPPGSVSESPIDGDRAPMLLSIERHRRIPINWAAAVEDESTRFAEPFDSLREQIETRWLLDSDRLDFVPKHADADVSTEDYCIRQFSVVALAGGNTFVENDIPEGSLLVRENPANHPNSRVFALEPVPGKKLEFGKTRWWDVSKVTEVFRMASGDEAWISEVIRRLGDITAAKFDARALDPLAIPELSSRIPVKTFASRLSSEWRREMLKDLVSQNVIRANLSDDSAKETYWKLNEDRRKGLLSGYPDKSAPLDEKARLEANPPSEEEGYPQEKEFLEQMTDNGAWVVKTGGRRYFVTLRPDVDHQELKLNDPVVYERAWDTAILNLEPLAWAPPGSTAPTPVHIPYSYLETVDLSPQLIVSEYARLKTEWDILNQRRSWATSS